MAHYRRSAGKTNGSNRSLKKPLFAAEAILGYALQTLQRPATARRAATTLIVVPHPSTCIATVLWSGICSTAMTKAVVSGRTGTDGSVTGLARFS